MVTILVIITLVSLLVPVYVYVGYPLVLQILVLILPARKVNMGSITPHVTLITSCYNEAHVIEEKIRNCLELDYAPDKIEFIFVSDGSDDGTDEIIEKYSAQGIKLIKQEGRLGKTSGLNFAVPQARGEIIVFSDANAMYSQDAIGKLVRNFYDTNVGYVVGAALYSDSQQSSAGENENTYWNYELNLKELESRLHSVVGGDGAIYAIRKDLYEILDTRDISDFVNPLQIIIKGYRGIFEREAICMEGSAGSFHKEGLRKERIVNRSIRGLINCKSVMNPLKAGFFSFEVISHKLLRWLIPFFLLVGLFGITLLSSFGIPFFQFLLGGAIVFLSLALLGFNFANRSNLPSALFLPYYFVVVNFFAMKGIWRYLLGETQVTWTSSRAQEDTVMFGARYVVFTLSLLVLVFLSYRLYLDLNI